MGGESWLSDILAGVMILTTLYCVGRTVLARAKRRPAEHDVDVVHALMGVAMAGMLVASLKTLPAGAWAVVFAAAGAWYVVQIAQSYRASGASAGQQSESAAHRHHHLPHLAMCCAMVYMLLAVPAVMRVSSGADGGMGMGGSSAGSRFPLLALVLTLTLVGFAVWDTDRLSRLPQLAPARATAVRVEAGLAMARANAFTSSAPGLKTGAAATDPTAVTVAQGRSGGLAGVPVAPRLALCCQIAMGATMAYMLVLML